ncbi:LysR family transcriptional regulator [Pleionea sp. CnH1-48]|uniref:LysR family transcriptional regulator n=1 Tax=Pleionea sp. CnH1-48 TaxID=2954494 RepID=UPI0020971932|nr:LysR family transcriptional regulator [Pleionea sp. CnH1-48]MCO7226047.1 LysR family transcriptional regulator [Pleionea sp. CnH1-48]
MRYELVKDMTLFVEVVRQGTFAGAAKMLNIPNSTLSRRIAALEKRLGTKLLIRSTRKMELSNAGELFYQQARGVVDEAQRIAFDMESYQAQPKGLLRVSMTADFAALFVTPWLATFLKDYSDIQIDIDTSPYHVDLVKEHFDLVLRLGLLSDSRLIKKSITYFEVIAVASSAYLQEHGAPSHPSELVNHSCIRLTSNKVSDAQLWHFVGPEGDYEQEVQGAVWSNNLSVCLQMACAGVGIAAVSPKSCYRLLKEKKLQRILPSWQLKPIELSALLPSRYMPSKTRLFLEYLSQHLASIEA